MKIWLAGLVVLGLCGCAPQSVKKAPRPGGSGVKAETPASAAVREQLTTCLFEAGQLSRLEPVKYRKVVEGLNQDIRMAKYYARIADGLSATTSSTLTPMYQYRVNDRCNTISQLLLTALKKGEILREEPVK